MDTERLNRLITLGANIGILLGLVLVGYEIEQNSVLVRAQIIDSNFSDQQRRALTLAGDNSAKTWAKSLDDPGTMTLADIFVIEAELRATLLHLRRNAQMEEVGLFTGRWRDDFETFGRQFTTPIGRAYWAYWYDDSVDWMQDVQAYIDKAEPTLQSDYFIMLQESLGPHQE